MTDVHPTLRLAAALADPFGSTLPPADDRDLSGMAQLLRRNKATLLPAAGLGRPDVAIWLEQPELKAALAAEADAYRHLRAQYAIVKAALRGRGVEDILIKSVGTAPSFPHTSDNTDDLVRRDAVAPARAALLACGYVELKNLEEPRKFFFKRFSAGQEVAAFHLHEHVGWAVSFMDERLLFSRARNAPDDGDLRVPHPEDALLITTAHALYENKAVKLGDMAKVRQCLRSGQVDWANLHRLAQAKGWGDGLNVIIALFARLEALLYAETLIPAAQAEQATEALASWQRERVNKLTLGALRMPLPVGFVFSKRLMYAKQMADTTRPVGVKVYDIVRHTLNGAKLKLNIQSQPGMLVTFSGVDGSGKTAHAQALLNAFARCGIQTSYLWSRGGSSRFTSAFVALGKRAMGRSAPAATTQAGRASGRKEMMRNPLVRVVWESLVMLDLVGRYTLHVRLPLWRGKAVVCDRYTYDALADLAAAGSSGKGLPLRLLVWLSPRPALSFVLTAPEVEALARKEGEAPAAAMLREQSAFYATLAAEQRLALKDTARPFAEVSDKIVRHTIQCYYQRYHTVLNALFLSNPMPSR